MSIEGLYPILIQAAEGAGEGARELALARAIDIMPLAGMVLALLMTAILAVVLVLVLRSRSQAHERLVSLAIQHNQPEVAREIVGRRPLWVLWIVLGLVAMAVADSLDNIWAILAVAILAVATAPAWLPVLTGAREGKKSRKQEPASYTPTAVGPTRAPAAPPAGEEAPKSQEQEKGAGSGGISNTLSSWLMMF